MVASVVDPASERMVASVVALPSKTQESARCTASAWESAEILLALRNCNTLLESTGHPSTRIAPSASESCGSPHSSRPSNYLGFHSVLAAVRTRVHPTSSSAALATSPIRSGLDQRSDSAASRALVRVD